MIGALAVVVWSGVASDDRSGTLGIDLDGGVYVLGYGHTNWLEARVRLEWRQLVFADLGASMLSGPGVIADPRMVSGMEPVPERHGRIVCAGLKMDWGLAWIAAGAGWAYARLDTQGVFSDPRRRLIDDGSGSRVRIEQGEVNWIWTDRRSRSAPYAMSELGVGWDWIACGLRAEYRFGFGLGGFLQYRSRLF